MAGIRASKANIRKALIYTIAGGILLTSPYGGIALARILTKAIDKKHKNRAGVIVPESYEEQVRKGLYWLRKQKYVELIGAGDGEYKLELTSKGKDLLGEYSFSDFRITPKSRWDGQWRTFVFDVPEKKRYVRDVLREKLQGLGFFQFQRSVWIYPHPCEEEMRYICEYLGAQSYALIFTGVLHNDLGLKNYFYRKGVLNREDIS